MNLRKTIERALAGYLPRKLCFCPVCERHMHRFMPYRRRRSALMQAIDCIGSDTGNFSCPLCGAHDRERHLLLYLRATGLLDSISGKDVLHFAPEARLTPLLLATHPRSYQGCDLFPHSAGIRRVDITCMPFSDETFDVVIANHILEHVDDDRQAASEIARVLRPGGIAILQTPYSAMLHSTWEDAGIVSDSSRLQAFGQEDHVRLYGRDIFERISSSGLSAEVRTHQQLLPDVDARQVGVNEREPFFLFRKSLAPAPDFAP
jgi:SAM-dependent methyltransferase